MEIWTCKDPIVSIGEAPPEEVVAVSGFGYANSRMAGGDFDGDSNMLCFHLRLVPETEAEVAKLNTEGIDIEKEVKKELAALQTQREEQQQEQEVEDLGPIFEDAEPRKRQDTNLEYAEYALKLPTPKLCSWACAIAAGSRREEDMAIFLKGCNSRPQGHRYAQPLPGTYDRGLDE